MKNSFHFVHEKYSNNQRLKFLEVLCEVLLLKNDGYSVVRWSEGESDL